MIKKLVQYLLNRLGWQITSIQMDYDNRIWGVRPFGYNKGRWFARLDAGTRGWRLTSAERDPQT